MMMQILMMMMKMQTRKKRILWKVKFGLFSCVVKLYSSVILLCSVLCHAISIRIVGSSGCAQGCGLSLEMVSRCTNVSSLLV